MMFLGSVLIASFGAAGVLSAIAAAIPSHEDGYAVGYLIGTSVSSVRFEFWYIYIYSEANRQLNES